MKQRLVGAIVLVALAVIFLPMLLDGSGQSGPRDVAIEIPEQPQSPRNRLSEPEGSGTDSDAATSANANPSSSADSRQGTTTEGTMTTDEGADGTANAEQAPPVDADPTQSADATDSDAAESESESSSATDETDTQTAAPESGTDPSGTSESEAAASAAGAEESGPTSWVVQVGSFGRETNALVLRDRLRELGFDAFVEQGETDQGTVWRVRVGPVASRDAADRLSERVTDERGGSALVMTHP